MPVAVPSPCASGGIDRSRLESLRALIGDARSGNPVTHRQRRMTTPLGIDALDAVLPWGGLPAACLHEMIAGDIGAAATGFCAHLLARIAGVGGTVVWCRPRMIRHGPRLYAPGLLRFGLELSRLLVVHARSDTDVLWAMEEALRSGAPAAVLGETAAGAPIALRRLQLAAERGGVTGLLLRPFGAATRAGPATTRWRIGAAPGGRSATARWQVQLLRCAAVAPTQWLLDWSDETHRLTVAAPVCDRSAASLGSSPRSSPSSLPPSSRPQQAAG